MIGIFNSEVLEVRDLTKDVKLVKLSAPEGFDFKAGQYLSLSVLHNGKKIRKPLSISSPPEIGNKFIEFCVKIIPGGLASEFVKGLKKKDKVELFGPAGKFVVSNFDKGLIFIAAGVGIAPFMSIIPDLLNKNFEKEIILLKSSRSEAGSLYDKELNELAKRHSNFRFYNVFSHPEKNNANKGHVRDFFERYISKNFEGNFYVCGLREMIEDSKRKLISMGFTEERIFYEKFD